MEDFEDGLGPDIWEGCEYDEDQSWGVDDDLAKIDTRETLEALENPLSAFTPKTVPGGDIAPGSLLLLEEDQENETPPPDNLPSHKPVTNFSVDIPASTLVTPRYLYQGEDTLPAPPEREWKAVQKLLEEHQRRNDEADDFIEFELDQFTIYSEPYMPGITKNYEKMRYAAELRPLQHLSIKPGCARLFVDGVLSVGDTRYFVRQIPFEELPIGNYGVSEHTVGSDIWIRSRMNAKTADRRGGQDIYYHLRTPSVEYRRYHKGFLWIVDLAKHIIDYLSVTVDEQRRVVFRDFRSDFSEWLTKTHHSSEAFDRWRSRYPSKDFCVAFIANLEFIYKEAFGVLGYSKIRSIYLWREIRDFTAYSDVTRKVPATPASVKSSRTSSLTPGKRRHIPKTIVTPYIGQLFNHLPCGMMLEATSPSPASDKLRRNVTDTYHLESSTKVHTSAKQVDDHGISSRIQIGDVISTPRDEDEHSNWTRETSAGFGDVDRWFGLVQRIHKLRDGNRSFDVIWFYRPIDTLCGTMKYPWNNELFLSDHCSCRGSQPKIKESEVLSVHRIDWRGSSKTDAEFFCRQTYLHEDRQWVTFQKSHLRCCHCQDETEDFPYKIGDTLLVLIKSDDEVEPCELLTLPDRKDSVSFRLLHRRHRLTPGANIMHNELLYSEETILLKTKRIHGRCLVRFFRPEEQIPPPYDRNGVGNAFFITHRLASGQIIPLEESFASLRQGFNPLKSFPKLRGVDLFCGGGNFGRGLEEGGAIEMKWANDINVRAIHTYMANITNDVHPFAGSIDDMQRLALEGKFSDKVPIIGSVDFVSGGSPCPGFSRLTIDKATPEQRKNQSLVAAFASFIDTYRPKFGLLENVMEIVQSRGKRGEDVFCQLICAIVGLGYQAHFFLLDAWSYGSPQSRSRVFLCFASPGLKLPQMPLHSHSHFDPNTRTKTLGWLPNNQPMAERRVMPTPFKFVSAEEATADLPDIMDGKADCCISFPDHRLAYGITKSFRAQLSVIPMHPYGMNFRTTWNDGHGIMTKAERKFFPEKGLRVVTKESRAWGRSFPNKVMQTVTTTPSPADARIGRLLHWKQNRVLSVMESRRAQGFRDHEVILGQPTDQWRVIGNSVAREVSLALGLSFREAWLGSLTDGEEVEPAVLAPNQPSIEYHAHEESPDITQLNTPPWATSRRGTPTLEAPQVSSSNASSLKRPLSSTLEVRIFVSKIAKTSKDQMAREERVASDVSASASSADDLA